MIVVIDQDRALNVPAEGQVVWVEALGGAWALRFESLTVKRDPISIAWGTQAEMRALLDEMVDRCWREEGTREKYIVEKPA